MRTLFLSLVALASGLQTPRRLEAPACVHRRTALSTIGTASAATVASLPQAALARSRDEYPIKDVDGLPWKSVLTGGQYFVLRDGGTEPPNSSPLVKEARRGVFVCAGCVSPLFDSTNKFDSGTGWPSFAAPRKDAVDSVSNIFGADLRCARCGGHLGAVFKDGAKFKGARARSLSVSLPPARVVSRARVTDLCCSPTSQVRAPPRRASTTRSTAPRSCSLLRKRARARWSATGWGSSSPRPRSARIGTSGPLVHVIYGPSDPDRHVPHQSLGFRSWLSRGMKLDPHSAPTSSRSTASVRRAWSSSSVPSHRRQ